MRPAWAGAPAASSAAGEFSIPAQPDCPWHSGLLQTRRQAGRKGKAPTQFHHPEERAAEDSSLDMFPPPQTKPPQPAQLV